MAKQQAKKQTTKTKSPKSKQFLFLINENHTLLKARQLANGYVIIVNVMPLGNMYFFSNVKQSIEFSFSLGLLEASKFISTHKVLRRLKENGLFSYIDSSGNGVTIRVGPVSIV